MDKIAVGMTDSHYRIIFVTDADGTEGTVLVSITNHKLTSCKNAHMHKMCINYAYMLQFSPFSCAKIGSQA